MTPDYAGIRDMALMRARCWRKMGDYARARDFLALAYWCRGRLRAIAPRPHREVTP